ncbi:MAG TPA: T9SS type A sorting domain-containing protein [Chitinophagales bacterium]|nr:T9SS type A sorting domain-containing protein [Chitinophagales bacterium]
MKHLYLIFCLGVLLSTRLTAQITFQKTYGVESLSDYAQSIIQTPDEGYLVAGLKQVIGTDWRLMLMRTDKYGNEVWTKLFAYPPNSIEPSSIENTNDGNYIITGLSGYDVFLLKVDTQGNEMWHKIYETPDKDWGKEAKQALDNGYIIAGWRAQTSYPSRNDMLLVRTNEDGDTLWTRVYHNDGISNTGYAIDQLPDSSIVLAGTTGLSSTNLYIVRVKFNGDTIWTKTINSLISGTAYDVTLADNGNIIVAGYSTLNGCSQPVSVEMDLNGNLIWYQIYTDGPCGWAYSVTKTSDNGYALFGLDESYDCYLIKTNSSGNQQWFKKFHERDANYGYCMRQTSDDGFIMTGITSSNGYYPDILLIKTDSTGNVLSGINEIQNADIFLIFPNPTSNNLEIQNNSKQVPQFSCYNSLGEKVISKLLTNKTSIIDLSAYSNGIYFYNLGNDKQIIESGKIIKQ